MNAATWQLFWKAFSNGGNIHMWFADYLFTMHNIFSYVIRRRFSSSISFVFKMLCATMLVGPPKGKLLVFWSVLVTVLFCLHGHLYCWETSKTQLALVLPISEKLKLGKSPWQEWQEWQILQYPISDDLIWTDYTKHLPRGCQLIPKGYWGIWRPFRNPLESPGFGDQNVNSKSIDLWGKIGQWNFDCSHLPISRWCKAWHLAKPINFGGWKKSWKRLKG